MPRLRKKTTTVDKRIQTSDRYYTRNTFAWVDPFPEVHGTKPEKMVYEALTRLGIPFYFLNDITFSDPAIDFLKEYQVDFVIPGIKAVIEVQGAFWHSKPKTVEADSFKMAVYEAFGYTVYAWWDYEIESDLGALLASSGLLLTAPRMAVTGGKSSELTPLKRTKVDSSKGIRTLNSRRKKYHRTFVGVSRRNLRKVKSNYAA